MLQPPLLPHRLLGVMGQYLNAPLGHYIGLDPRNVERGLGRSRHRLDRAFHVHQSATRKPLVASRRCAWPASVTAKAAR